MDRVTGEWEFEIEFIVSMIQIVNYSPKYEEAHFKFASLMFGPRRKRRNSDYIYWKFRGVEGVEMPSLKLAVSDGEVVGQLGVIPCKVRLGHEIIDAQWACDLMVRKNYRGKGIAAGLYENAHAQKILTIGSNPSPSAEKSMLRNRYNRIPGPQKYFIPYHLGTPLRMKGINVNLLNRTRNPFLSLFQKKDAASFFAELDVTVEQMNNVFGYDNLSEASSVFVDKDFLQWRYLGFKDYYPGIKLYKMKEAETYFSGYFMGGTYFITDLKLAEARHITKIISFILEMGKGMSWHGIKFLNNERVLHFPFLKPVAIKYRTDTVIIYHTENIRIKEEMEQRYFYYTLRDSDENI
ncbi:acetyltransferase (GNAT) family protein [Marinilabilia salmonicolor]|nr:acetyltransferase (GNAT) family protein [Marinilabilia salmonicolor]